MDWHLIIYYIQAGFNNIIRLIEAGGVGLACYKAYYYFQAKESEQKYHQLRNSEHSIDLFKNRIKPRIKSIYKQEYSKKLLNQYTTTVMNRLHDIPHLPKNYTFDNLPKSHQIIVQYDVKHILLNNILDILEEWALGVKESPNSYHLIYLETHEDLVPFLNHFYSEFRYVTMNADKYRAITYVYHKYQRSDNLDRKN